MQSTGGFANRFAPLAVRLEGRLSGGIPVGRVVESMERAGLELRDAESLREHYALTLHRWVANLAAHRDAAIAEAGADLAPLSRSV